MISVRELVKEYRIHERPAGLRAALKSVFQRQYKTARSVAGISFSIAPCQPVGLLRTNGAGKTTTLKVLSGLLHPTSGEVQVAGHEPRRRQIPFLRQITLVMGQKQQLLWDLPPVDTFAMNRAIYDIPKAEFDETVAELSE